MIIATDKSRVWLVVYCATTLNANRNPPRDNSPLFTLQLQHTNPELYKIDCSSAVKLLLKLSTGKTCGVFAEI